MEQNNYTDNTILEMFGLTYEQSKLMFSVQKYIAKYDRSLNEHSNFVNQKTLEAKNSWLYNWESKICAYLNTVDEKGNNTLYKDYELTDAFRKEFEKSPNKTWYYIVVLECLEFIPYSPLGGTREEEKEMDKRYAKCTFDSKKCREMVKDLFARHGYIQPAAIDRLHKTYTKSLDTISGKSGLIVIQILTAVAVAAASTALAAICAGPIAIALFGSQFAGLSGAALTSACLAFAGGGAIAVGGAGMAGGVMFIAGGGALLGLAGGGTIAGITSSLLQMSPEYALTQAAKLETILKEVILNAQQDVVSAQKIIQQYKDQIVELQKEITKLELENQDNKDKIKNIEKCIKYMKKSCKNMDVFTSSFEVGMNCGH